MRKMKKTLILAILVALWVGNVSAITRNIQENYKFTYVILDASGNPVSEQTVTLRIQKASNGYWYDFSDDSFKASPTTPTVNLSYDTTGEFYYYTFDPPSSENSAEAYVFVVDNANETYKDHQQEVIAYEDIGNADKEDVIVYVGQ